MKRLSVVTITFNDHEGLIKTSKSIDDSKIEWIVIDGSNSENAKSQNTKLLSSRNVLHIQEQDTGRFNAMNKGLGFATGDLICFMNSGDQFAHTNVTTEILNSWSTHQWNWAVGDTIAIDSNDEQQWSWPTPKHRSLKLRIGVNSYCHQATVYEIQTLRELGGFYEDSLFSDWLTSLQLSEKTKPFLSNSLWAYFLTNGISSQQTLQFWSRESVRLRRFGNLKIGGFRFTDSLIQRLAQAFLQTKRGRLIRTDLSRKYPI